MMRRCWTCCTEHDPDDPCKQSPMARAERAAGGNSSSLFGGRDATTRYPVIIASYDSQCSEGDDILPGDEIRADGLGGWIHIGCEQDFDGG